MAAKIRMRVKKRDPKKYDPVEAIRFHFKEFYVWVGFFIAINGGLLAAYSSEGLKSDNLVRILIILLGFISSYLFFICCMVYIYCITEASKEIEKDGGLGKEVKEVYGPIFKETKIATTVIVSIFSLCLMITWSSLFIIIVKGC